MMWVQTMFHKNERWLRWKDIKEIGSDELLGSVRVEVQILKGLMNEMFDVLQEAVQ